MNLQRTFTVLSLTVIANLFVACGISRGPIVLGEDARIDTTHSSQVTPFENSRTIKKNLPQGTSLKITTRFLNLKNLQQYPLQAALVEQSTGIEDPIEPSKLTFTLEGNCSGLSVEANILTVQFTQMPDNCALTVQHIYYIEKDGFHLKF